MKFIAEALPLSNTRHVFTRIAFPGLQSKIKQEKIQQECMGAKEQRGGPEQGKGCPMIGI